MSKEYKTECAIYYTQHISSKIGAIVTTVMLSAVLVLFLLGRSTLDYSALRIPEKEETIRVIAMKIHTISEERIEATAKSAPVQGRRVKQERIQPLKQQSVSNKDVIVPKKEERALFQDTTNVEEVNTQENIDTHSTLPQENSAQQQEITSQSVIQENNNPEDVTNAVASLLQNIERYKTYPRAARRAGYNGVVEIKVILNAQGILTQYALYKTSGYTLLDESALDVVKKLQGKRITNAVLYNPVEAIIPIRYSLNS